jgi:3'-phosphoadenosine 5'-phosphosulfate sulfotransferase
VRDAILLKEKPLERGESEFEIGDVYLAPNGEFYIELKKGGTTMNMRIQELKKELNSGKSKIRLNT